MLLPEHRPILKTLTTPVVNAIKYLIDKVCSDVLKVTHIPNNLLTERLASHMASHRPHRCTITNCGKEFKFKAHLARHCATAHGLAMRSGSPRPIMKTRAAFYLCSTLAARVARRLCSKVLKPRHATRNPFLPININAIRLECKIFFGVLLKRFLFKVFITELKAKRSSRTAFLRCLKLDQLKGEKSSIFLTD